MQEAQKISGQEKENLAGEVMESMGMSDGSAEKIDETPHAESNGIDDGLPDGVKARLGRQEKRHQKQIRDMQSQLQAMQERMGQTTQTDPTPVNPYSHQPVVTGSEDERIHRAVTMALQAREMQEKKVEEQKRMARVQDGYRELQDHLDNASNKYDDFDDVVRSPNAAYTAHMRDAALLLPNAADVLYKLGKNPDELNRIAALHPLDQAKEMVKLSHALVNGGAKPSNANARPIGQIKNNPVTSHAVSETTPISDLRARMKAGWK